jgi:hypothetical protein
VLLSPSTDRLQRLLNKWPDAPEGPTRGEHLGGDVSDLEAILERGVEVTRGPGQFGADTSVANSSSIAFLFEHANVSVLLTGDAYASVLVKSIKELLAVRKQQRLTVDVFKLSHHGSRQNMTDDLLKLIDPRRVLVCTDGSKFEHPDEDAIVKVRRHYPDAEIYFTDNTPVIKGRAVQVGGILPTASPVVLPLSPP